MRADTTQIDRKPDCIVIDTSIWRSQLLLKSPFGVALVYTLSRQGGFIGIPQVVELELKNQIVEAGLEAGEKVKQYSQIVRTLVDDPFSPDLPTRGQLEEKVDARLAELSPILARELFTLEHAKAALAMVNAKLPPNGDKNQQFKDSAIWQAVLTLSKRFSTHLVTGDKGFFRDRDPSKGMAPNLHDDCYQAGSSVSLYYSDAVSDCLDAISRDEPVFDRTRVVSLIEVAVIPSLREKAEKQRYVVKELVDVKIKAFRTAEPNRLAVDYSLTVRIEDDPSIGEQLRRGDCRAIIHGSSYYDQRTDTLADHFVQRMELKHQNERGGGSYVWSPREYDAAFPFARPI